MGRQMKKNKNIGRKIAIGKRVMKAIKKSENGMTIAQLRKMFNNEGNALMPSEKEIHLSVKNGLQRRTLLRTGMLYKAADTMKSNENNNCRCPMCRRMIQKGKNNLLKSQTTSSFQCAICLEERKFKKFVRLWCNHAFCMACLGIWDNEVNRCPLCRKQLRYSEIL